METLTSMVMSRNGCSTWRRALLLWLSACLVLAASLVTSAVPALASFPGGDGRLAVAIDDGDGARRLALMNPNNGEREWLTTYGGHPAWSPDGSRILFDYEEFSGDDGPEGLYGGIATMLADGSGRHDVSLGLDPRNREVQVEVQDDQPSFAPDGQHFLYTRYVPGPGWSMWVATLDGTTLDGTHRQRLRSGEAAKWSPDGRWIAYIKSTKSRSSASELQCLWIMSAKSHRRVRRISRQADGFDWSPDGKRLVYARSGDLFVKRVDGTGARRLASPRSYAYGPVWSPSGRSIAFTGATGGREVMTRFSIWTVSLRSGTFKRLWIGRWVNEEDEDLFWPQLAWQATPRLAR